MVGAKFSAPVQTGAGAHPASCTMGTGSFPRVKSGQGVTLTPHHLLVPWSWKSRAITLLSLWAVRPVQSLSRAIPLLPLWAVRPVQSLSRAILLLPLWAVRPVQSLSACTRVTFTFIFFITYTVSNHLHTLMYLLAFCDSKWKQNSYEIWWC
jgi:hypothetical protein